MGHRKVKYLYFELNRAPEIFLFCLFDSKHAKESARVDTETMQEARIFTAKLRGFALFTSALYLLCMFYLLKILSLPLKTGKTSACDVLCVHFKSESESNVHGGDQTLFVKFKKDGGYWYRFFSRIWRYMYDGERNLKSFSSP